MKLQPIAVSSFFLSFLFSSCGGAPQEMPRAWKQNDSPLGFVLSDSVPLPADFPKYFRLGHCTGSTFIYSYVVAQEGPVTDIRLAVMDLEKGTSKSISTGNDRFGQMRGIAAMHLSDSLVYTLDCQAQIMSYDLVLVLRQSPIFEYPYREVSLTGEFLFKNGDDFITLVGSRGDKGIQEFSPLIKVKKNGKALYLNEAIKVRHLENQMRDYPELLADAYGNRAVIVAQHQRGFFIVNLNDGDFTRHELPSVIPVDEDPVLNKVLNMQGQVQGQYVKNAAFKWCSFRDGKVDLVFHHRPKEKGGPSRYQLYSLDVENKVVSMIDSLPFDKPYFVGSPTPRTLYVLENRVLYKYLLR